MRKYLLPNSGNYYKANLHCHTTNSDGRLTPEQVKERYVSQGHSVIAHTDHDIMIPHPELKDDNFLPLTGYEMEFTEPQPADGSAKRTAHICLIAPTEKDTKQVCWHREKYLFGHAPEYRHLANFDDSLPDFERQYSVESVNKAIATAEKSGYFVTYNHPIWSREHIEDIVRYEGMDAMEIANNSCLVSGYEDYVPWLYDIMLFHGKNDLYVIAADDNHNVHPFGSIRCDACGGWTMINAESLTYENIFAGLKSGACYASRGPEIKALYFEDGQVHVECSDAVTVKLISPMRKGRIAYATEDAPVNSASFKIAPDDKYIRVTVTDKNGKTADTRFYEVAGLFEE